MSWPAPIRKPTRPRAYYTIHFFAGLAGIDDRTMRKMAVNMGITREVEGRSTPLIVSALVKREAPELYERLMRYLHGARE